jgi:hypothetical protein
MKNLRRLLPGSLGSLAGMACALCCAVPFLLAAGVSRWPSPPRPDWRGGGAAVAQRPRYTNAGRVDGS